MPAVLVVDDEQGTREATELALKPLEVRVSAVGSAEEGLSLLSKEVYDVVVCDIRLIGMDGLEFQKRVRAEYPDVPVVIITAFAAVETAVRALRQGAYDYVPKPFSREELRGAVRRALERRRLMLENDSLREVAKGIIGGVWTESGSAAVKRLYDTAGKVASSRVPIFISGESGTGKEILARTIHENSPRNSSLFLPLNCATFVETLADSQLFGHVHGAFTGAVSDQRGYIEMASGGTLFLDEISELKPEFQSKLLRVLEDGRVRRLGSEREATVDVRIVVAAQKEPEQLVHEGKLRGDLYYRLGTVHLHVPPLRERREDIAGLALHFLGNFSREIKKPIAGLDPEALTVLSAYAWPGNIRELKNVMERAAIFVRPGGSVGVSELSKRLRRSPGAVTFAVDSAPPLTLEELSARYIRHVVDSCEGSLVKAARILGVSPSTLWRHGVRASSASPADPPSP